MSRRKKTPEPDKEMLFWLDFMAMCRTIALKDIGVEGDTFPDIITVRFGGRMIIHEFRPHEVTSKGTVYSAIANRKQEYKLFVRRNDS